MKIKLPHINLPQRRTLAVALCLGFGSFLIAYSSFGWAYLDYGNSCGTDYVNDRAAFGWPFFVLALPFVFLGYARRVGGSFRQCLPTFAACWAGVVAGVLFIGAGTTATGSSDRSLRFLFDPPRDAMRTFFCAVQPGEDCSVLRTSHYRNFIPFRGSVAAHACRSGPPLTHTACLVALEEKSLPRDTVCRINAARPVGESICHGDERATHRRALGLLTAGTRYVSHQR